MKLSIVTTLYYSAPYVSEFYERSVATARALVGEDFEVVMVNDGSPDDSVEIALSIAANDQHLTVVDLSRNFGHHKALMTGLAHSKGELVYLIDSDLEEHPEWLPDLLAEMKASGVDGVYGVQRRRKGGWFERLTGGWYYSLFKAMTGETLPENWVTARVMTRRFVDALLLHDEREMSFGGLYLATGFRHSSILVDKSNTSPTTYTLGKKIALMITGVTALSSRPLIGISYLGFFIALFSFAFVVYVSISRLLTNVPVDGWASLIASVWLVGGLCICFIGVVGIYVSKIYSETKRRPYTIVRSVYNKLNGDI